MVTNPNIYGYGKNYSFCVRALVGILFHSSLLKFCFGFEIILGHLACTVVLKSILKFSTMLKLSLRAYLKQFIFILSSHVFFGVCFSLFWRHYIFFCISILTDGLTFASSPCSLFIIIINFIFAFGKECPNFSQICVGPKHHTRKIVRIIIFFLIRKNKNKYNRPPPRTFCFSV